MKPDAWRRTLLPLTPLYSSAVYAKNWLTDRRLFRQRRLGHPVVSVGSLSAGGAGKTPVVLMLAAMFQQLGRDVRILTRGYGRANTAIERVDPAGDAGRFGDEPLLMARCSKAIVYVGANRYRAGLLSQQEEGASAKTIYLLDDGFQHRKLARDLDIVLVTSRELDDSLLPAGNLREPLSSLRRASAIFLREDEPGVADQLSRTFGASLPPVFMIRRRLELSSEDAPPSRTIAFCGVARPKNFLEMIAAKGIAVVAFSIFRDHHAYSSHDVDSLLELAKEHRADGFITTEKDAVKLTREMRDRLQDIGGLMVPALRAELAGGEAAMNSLLRLLDTGQSDGT